MKLRLAVSLDVEEEGLFGGSYATQHATVRNVAHLERLTPLLRRFQIPATLFCAHSVFADAASCAVLERLRDRDGVEIGAHLHHWNTPPLAAPSSGVSAGDVPLDLMEDKLATLFEAGRRFQGAPLTSFRMGRWDLRRAHWALLARQGVLADASVRPLHCGGHGPDHFDAPADPYMVRVGDAEILEAPLTCTPLFRGLPGLLRALPGGAALRGSVRHWGALALLPVYHPLWAMRRITRLHVARGGRVLALTWHSSEMMPGGAPHIPDAAAVERLLDRLTRYLDWLTTRWEVEGCTLDDLRRRPPVAAPPGRSGGDWLPAPCASVS